MCFLEISPLNEFTCRLMAVSEIIFIIIFKFNSAQDSNKKRTRIIM